jgi:hypothetical protein
MFALRRPVTFVQTCQISTQDVDLSGGGASTPANGLSSGLARAARSHQRQKVTLLDIQADVVQSDYFKALATKLC